MVHKRMLLKPHDFRVSIFQKCVNKLNGANHEIKGGKKTILQKKPSCKKQESFTF